MVWLPEGLEGVTQAMATMPDGAEAAEEAEPSAESGAVLARQPTKTKPRTAKGPAPTSGDVADVARVGKRILGQIPQLERERVISTVYAEELKRRIEWFIDRAKQRRPGEQAQIRKDLRALRAHPDELRKRAAEGRSTKGKTLISDFKVTPPVIRVGEGEAARISFVLGDKVKSVTAMIVVHERDPGEDREADRTWMRTFRMDPKPGYHQAIWDGTFKGMLNKPPKTGTYTLEISVDGEKHREQIIERIRVENPDDETVLPRLESGREVSTFTFDGQTLDPHRQRRRHDRVAGDVRHEAAQPAQSGEEGLHRSQAPVGREPRPDPGRRVRAQARPLSGAGCRQEGRDLRQRRHRPPSGGRCRSRSSRTSGQRTAASSSTWTYEQQHGRRIGIPPTFEGKFTQMMSLIARSNKDIKLAVSCWRQHAAAFAQRYVRDCRDPV